MNHANSIAAALDYARKTALEIAADPYLTDEGKAVARAQRVDPALADAREVAALWLSSTAGRAEKARARHKEAQRAAAGRVDVTRRDYAFNRAKTLAETASWDAIAANMRDAAAMGDEHSLAAWRDLEGLLRGRFDGRTGPASDAKNGIMATYHVVDAAWEALPPDPVVALAAQELSEAETAAAEARTALTRADFRGGVQGHQPVFTDILAGGARTVESGTPGEPGWMLERQGGVGAFG